MGPALVGSLGSLCRYKRFFPALAALVSPVQTIFFLAAHFFHFMCPQRPASWAGNHARSPVFKYVSQIHTFLGGETTSCQYMYKH
jgi:hypothetical protein